MRTGKTAVYGLEMRKVDVLCLLLVACGVRGEYNDGGFMPSSSFRTEDQLAEPSARAEKSREEREQNDRTQRFGISTYGTTGAQV
ncbi:hypothetical protein MSG28_006763 [Choristoneura fumiferana]|uniref:Uncharacterized protein n=1 Tax=Choristoneura fumiferana TaxID=7141 RepID=A0ACC0JL20_CHOFU|nr:hypothetical protein MSG28_006763 [Choristoneura fumiferana]